MSTLKFEIPDLPNLLEAIEGLNKKLSAYESAQQEGIWLDDAAVMTRLGISKSTLREWRDYYDLPFCQLGENRRYKPAEVDQWFSNFRKGNKQAVQIVNNALAKKAQKVA
ncbi:helix-turn-helix domain-containing protein [Siphonobacter sp. SORGH_AS_0500]|uniref:helix-turn-helix domain-containing protein n=1 Tax=Siphonobacter sp. SORGH_AS_0500 TaxID=1864824 RepID=UPI0028671710|nr:helix-turn-helix domain-containing protein [Siphonobacter sp. SORGH_AS_0500]MDR6194754.1 hypothetical protein [Siphonobacter sp. SORGH_AS_0500]